MLGDAIHGTTPFRGIGANIALRDADLLRRELIAAAKDSLRAAGQFASGSRAGRVMFKTVLRFVKAVPPLKRRAFSDAE